MGGQFQKPAPAVGIPGGNGEAPPAHPSETTDSVHDVPVNRRRYASGCKTVYYRIPRGMRTGKGAER